MWQLGHEVVLTRAVLAHCGIQLDPMCPTCNSDEESFPHCLLYCPRAMHIWQLCGVEPPPTFQNTADIFRWLQVSCSGNSCLVLIIHWHVWCSRNRLVFEGELRAAETVTARILAHFLTV